MNEVIWRACKISNLFKRCTPPSTNVPAKELEIHDYKKENTIALITRAEANNGIRGYIEKGDFPTISNAITYNDQFSLFLYHKYEFTTIKDHLSIIKCLNNNLQNILDSKSFVDSFLVIILNRVFSEEIFNYTFTGADYKFDREIILLPCLEVTKNGDYIWEENGHYYTLAVEYIERLMNEAKELREQKTIRLYEAERAKYERERAKYERERAKYEEGYKKERDVLVWKGFKLGDLYSFDSSNQYPFTQKQIDISDNKDDIHTIAVIAQSALNNGVIGYIENSDNIKKYISHGNMTFSLNFGICFYHSYDYVLLDTHGSIFRLMPNNQRYNELLEGNLQCNLFIAKLINKVCAKSLYNWQWKPNSSRASREIILLPCLEVTKNDDYIWEENGHYYTLAVEYISYMYLSGRVEFNQRLIDKYEYKY